MLKPLLRALYWFLFNACRAWGAMRGVRIEPSVQWRGRARFSVGHGSYIGARTVLSGDAGASVQIGERVWMGSDCEISALGRVDIGAHTTLQHRSQLHGDVRLGAGCTGAADLYISSGRHEFRRNPPLPIRLQDRARAGLPAAERSQPVEVGDDCWLGIGVAVMPGVRIGRGCVLGAHSVVTTDLPPYSIAVGSPARVIGQRLAYAPPAALDAARDEHLPYFDAGFSQIGHDEGDAGVPRVAGGLALNRAECRIALAVLPGQGVRLQLRAAGPGQLLHAGVVRSVPAGLATLEWQAAPDARGLLSFDWRPEGGAASACLVLLSAQAITLEEQP
ncbi:acyltransferase [Ideonella margarita]|uniref:Acyltransferase n=1 Tax=Ideonella margarita TaxID=2984191 RepID=A0ABU9BZL4_9BURK